MAGCTVQETSSPVKTAPRTERVVHLYIGNLQQELAPGLTLYGWGFGLWDPARNRPAGPPSVPGPEIRVREGEHVKVVLHNEQAEPHTIHFHGVDNSFAGDGTPDVSQKTVEQGETFTYEFDAPPPGTYFYHCHVEPDQHPQMGLYGAFIVEPREATARYDGEFVLMLRERDPRLSVAEAREAGQYPGTMAEGVQVNGEYDTLERHPASFTINGKIDSAISPLRVKKGGRYLIRLINAGDDVHSLHFHGHHVQVIASDGAALAKAVAAQLDWPRLVQLVDRLRADVERARDAMVQHQHEHPHK